MKCIVGTNKCETFTFMLLYSFRYRTIQIKGPVFRTKNVDWNISPRRYVRNISKKVTYDIPRCYINVLIPKRVKTHGRYKSTFSARVFPTTASLLKTRFLSRGTQRLAQFSSKLSRRIWRPIPRYASDFQTVNARGNLKVQVGLGG